MKKYKLMPYDIALIRVDESNAIFFHANTLQIYPINDLQLINFLERYSFYGYEKTKQIYSKVDFFEIYDFITNKIRESPQSIKLNDSNKDQISFNSVVMPIAAACNLKCPYCFAQTDNGFNFNSYSNKDVENVIDFLTKKNEDNKIINLIFFGGEPLLNVNVIEHTIQYAKNKYSDYTFNYSITTNGTILNKKIISLIKENNIAVLLSLDGPDNEFNLRKYHDGEKSIYNVLNNINIFKDSGIPIQLRATLVSTNPHILETHSFFENLNIPFDIVFAYASGNTTHSDLSSYENATIDYIKNEYNLLIDYYKDKLNKKHPIYNKALLNFSNTIKYRVIKNVACGTGFSYHTITGDGDIFSCPHLMNDKKYRIGDINNEAFDNTDVVAVPVDKIKACQQCWIRYLCLGGCTSEKILTGRKSNDSLKETSCELEKLKFKFILQMYYYASVITPEYLKQQDEDFNMPL